MSGESPAAIAAALGVDALDVVRVEADRAATDSGEAATASAPSPYVSTIAESPRSGFMSAGV